MGYNESQTISGAVLAESSVYTDEYPAYNCLGNVHNYMLRRINHRAGVYVVGEEPYQQIFAIPKPGSVLGFCSDPSCALGGFLWRI
jgi:hypothetical protein